MTEQEIHDICGKYNITNYSINTDGSIDVDGDVNLNGLGLTELPIKFNKVSGGFYCQRNQLTSLKGSPKEVGSFFTCYDNILTSLKDGPNYVNGGFYCQRNQLTSLEGGPVINESYKYYCLMESLISLEGYVGSYNNIVCYNKSNLVKKRKRSKTLKLLEEFHL